MEGLAAGLIRCTRDRNFTFNGEDKSEMATFVALMFTRVPSGRDWINKIAGQAMKAAIQEEAKDIEKFKDEFSKRQEQLGPLGISPEDLRELILSNDYEIIQQSKDFNIAKILEVTLILAPLIENLNWQIWHANGSQLYITSDNPVVTAIRKGGSIQFGAGFGSHGVEVTFTLTSRAALFMAHGAQEISIGIGNARIREINKRIAWCANRFLYAPQYSTPLKKYLDQHGGKVKYGENAFLPPN